MEADMQHPDSKPGAYYVSVARGADWRPLLGPFINDHAKALGLVDAARKKAEELDVKACWYSFGTVRVDVAAGEIPRAGILNSHFEKEIAS
jgi:hypothetical protein